MNAKGDANRSVRTTKKKLYNALIQLLQEKDLREITVRELTGLAGISRGTFYFHYADIYALMEQMEATQLEGLCSLLDGIVPNASQEDIALGLVCMVLQSIGSAAILSGIGTGISDYILIGNLTLLPQCRDIFPAMAKLYNVRFHIPKNSEFCTAIGAALSFEEIRNNR